LVLSSRLAIFTGVADHGVIQPDFRSDIADQHVAGIDADADFDRLAVVVDKVRLAHGALARQSGAAAIDGVIPDWAPAHPKTPSRHRR
jgi:hypothetical protein